MALPSSRVGLWGPLGQSQAQRGERPRKSPPRDLCDAEAPRGLGEWLHLRISAAASESPGQLLTRQCLGPTWTPEAEGLWETLAWDLSAYDLASRSRGASDVSKPVRFGADHIRRPHSPRWRWRHRGRKRRPQNSSIRSANPGGCRQPSRHLPTSKHGGRSMNQ